MLEEALLLNTSETLQEVALLLQILEAHTILSVG